MQRTSGSRNQGASPSGMRNSSAPPSKSSEACSAEEDAGQDLSRVHLQPAHGRYDQSGELAFPAIAHQKGPAPRRDHQQDEHDQEAGQTEVEAVGWRSQRAIALLRHREQRLPEERFAQLRFLRFVPWLASNMGQSQPLGEPLDGMRHAQLRRQECIRRSAAVDHRNLQLPALQNALLKSGRDRHTPRPAVF